MRAFTCCAVLVCALATPFPGPVHAQESARGRAADLTIGGAIQPQYRTSSVDGEADELFLRRARLRFDARVGELLDGRVEVEVGGGEAEAIDAWIRMTFDESLRVSVGQFKRAFSTFWLSSFTDLPIIERDGRVPGVDDCPGVGSVCTMVRLTRGLQFDNRDLGVRVDGSFGEGVRYLATATNGEGLNAPDVNDAWSGSGRLEVDALGSTMGVFYGVHDYLDGDGGTSYAGAGGFDVEVGTWRQGFHLLAALVAGRNWAIDAEPTFLAFQGLASWYVPVDAPRLAGIEPLLRVSWADPDGDGEGDTGFLVTPGLWTYVEGRNGIGLNVDVYAPDTGGTEVSVKIQTQFYF